MEFETVRGDITEQSTDALVNAAKSTDALVNAANTSLRMGTGVAGALETTAGQELNDEAVSKGPIELGRAALTDAYDLDAEYVIYAAAMEPSGGATRASPRCNAQRAGHSRRTVASDGETSCQAVTPSASSSSPEYSARDNLRAARNGPSGRQVRQCGVRVCREHGHEISTGSWLGA